MRDWKAWIKAAGVRALKTFGQTFASGITVGLAMGAHDWKYIFSTAAVSLIYSLATSLGGLPELKD